MRKTIRLFEAVAVLILLAYAFCMWDYAHSTNRAARFVIELRSQPYAAAR